jgi:hypothetical protein
MKVEVANVLVLKGSTFVFSSVKTEGDLRNYDNLFMPKVPSRN